MLERSNSSTMADGGTLAIARAAEQAILRGSGGDQPLVEILRMRLQRERDPGLRLRLGRAYLRLLRLAGMPVAVRWVRGDDPMLREAAYDALHDLGEAALPALIELAGSRDPSVRWCAYEVAEHTRRAGMIPVLVRGLQDEEPSNRWAASNGLIALGQRALMPVLVALVTAPATLTFHASARRVLVRLDLSHYGDLVTRLLDSLAHETTIWQSGPIAGQLLNEVRLDTAALSGRTSTPVRATAPAGTGRSAEQMTTRLATSIRPAGQGDAKAVGTLWDTCGLTPARRDEWTALTEGPTSAVLVAAYEGRLIGSVVASFDGWRAYVYHVAVDPSVRGHGLGHDLMDAAEHYLLAAGARQVHAAVDEENTEGLALAVSNGYLPEGERVLVKLLREQ